MRYDDFDEYNSRSSRGSSRKGSSSYSGGRDYGSRDYRDRDRSRDYRDDRDFDRGYSRDFDRGYDRRSDRYGSDRYSDRYGSSDRYSSRNSRDRYEDDFDWYDWERTAPNWDEHGSARKKHSSSGGVAHMPERRSGGGSSRGGSSSRSSSGSRPRSSSPSSRDRDRDSRSGGGNRRPPSDSQRRSSGSQRRSTPAASRPRVGMNLVPIVLGLVVIIIAAIILINVFGGGKSKYELEISSQTIVVGETAEASIKGIEEGDEPDITWSSSDSNVVSVDPSKDGRSCTLNAEAVGSATVAAVVDGKENVNTSIVVVKTAPGVVRIELAEKEATVRSGDTYTIQAKVIMEKDDMSPANITWESNDASVARVENGVITAQDVGQAIIKATAGEQTAEFVVKVVENPSAKPNDGTQSIGQKPEDGTEPDTGTGTGSGAATGGSTGNTGSGSGGTSGGAGTPTEGGGNSGSLDSDITGQTPAAGTEE